MTDLNLFAESDSSGKETAPSVGAPGPEDRPLAARMRPQNLEEFKGQRHLLGPGKTLRAMIERGELTSLILWGPPGSGKTTLAHLLAEGTGATLEAFSAVTEGVARVREIIAGAKERRSAGGRRTVLFCDEIHRFNKAQQDAFLPHVEDGTIILLGATTENPSFEVIRPLLSRAPVFVLESLGEEELISVLSDALGHEPRGLASMGMTWEEEVLRFIATESDGDARRALGLLEGAAKLVGVGGALTVDAAREAAQLRFALYDKDGEEHYNLISALHKAVRGSDPDGALYWLARMLAAGEDPLYLARRLIRMASEDVGLSDPGALQVAVAARDAFRFLGPPEGELALAEATLYLATAPKSNRVYVAWKEAMEAARETPGAPVPMHIRNAPTGLLRALGYGDGYRYDPEEPFGVSAQEYLPEGLRGRRFYRPGPYGHESTVRKRLEWWASKREEAARRTGRPSEPPASPGSGDG